MILAGKSKKFYRYMTRFFEAMTTKTRMLQKEGKPVTQFVLLINMENYNAMEQACVQCKLTRSFKMRLL